MPYIPNASPQMPASPRRVRVPGGHRHRPSALAAAAVAAIVAVAAVWIVMHRTRSDDFVIMVLRNIDSASATPDPDPVLPEIVSAAQQAGADGSTLVEIVAAGGDPITRSTVNLTVTGPDGTGIEPDTVTRNKEIARRVTEALQGPPQTNPTGNGRNLVGLFRAAEPYHPSVIYYVGFGLNTTGAANAQIQMHSISAAHAVEEIADQLPDLTDAQLHARFTSAAGAQAPLTIPSQEWRTEWWQHNAVAMGAVLASTRDVTGGSPPIGSASAPAIEPLPDGTDPHDPGATVTATATSDVTTTVTAAPPPAITLTQAMFVKNTSTLIDPSATAAVLGAWVDNLRPGPTGTSSITCIGRTAPYGTRDGAIVLSQERAGVVARQVRDLLGDVPITVTSAGRGYDDPVPGGDDEQRTVICTITP